MRFRPLFPCFFFLLLLMNLSPALAYDSGPSKPQDPLAEARAAIDNKDWPRAVDLLTERTNNFPNDADAFNLLGFSQRNAGDLLPALSSYEKALAIDPKHKGAHEYKGETYLKLNDLAHAETEQTRLHDLCPKGCEELKNLDEAIADYKKNRGN